MLLLYLYSLICARKEFTHSINHDKYCKTQLHDQTLKKETKRETFLKWCGFFNVSWLCLKIQSLEKATVQKLRSHYHKSPIFSNSISGILLISIFLWRECDCKHITDLILSSLRILIRNLCEKEKLKQNHRHICLILFTWNSTLHKLHLSQKTSEEKCYSSTEMPTGFRTRITTSEVLHSIRQ